MKNLKKKCFKIRKQLNDDDETDPYIMSTPVYSNLKKYSSKYFISAPFAPRQKTHICIYDKDFPEEVAIKLCRMLYLTSGHITVRNNKIDFQVIHLCEFINIPVENINFIFNIINVINTYNIIYVDDTILIMAGYMNENSRVTLTIDINYEINIDEKIKESIDKFNVKFHKHYPKLDTMYNFKKF